MGDSSNIRPPRRQSRRPRHPVVVPASPVNGEAALRAALHDRLGPALANLAMRLEVVEAAVADAALRAQFAELRLEAAALVAELGRIVHGEPPEPLATDGLVAAASMACARTERPGLQIDFTVSGAPVEPPLPLSDLLYRAVLEGTANVARHAEASRCEVRLRFGATDVSLEVEDDGKGIAHDHPPGPPTRRGLGLRNLRGSTRSLGGEMRLHRLPSGGSALSIRLPLPRRALPPVGTPRQR